MIRPDIREEIQELGFTESLLFDNPSFDNSIVGYTDDGRIVYDFDKMVHEFSEENLCDPIEATEFIEFNTIRSLPYVDSSVAPIIIYSITS